MNSHLLLSLNDSPTSLYTLLKIPAAPFHEWYVRQPEATLRHYVQPYRSLYLLYIISSHAPFFTHTFM